MHLWMLPLLLCVLQCSAQTICPDLRYQLRGPDNDYCYQYYDIGEDYSAANRSCVRDGGVLVYIDDSSEDNYLYQTFFISRGQAQFWIGLNDMATEGVFRWENSSAASMPTYFNWTADRPVGNTLGKDCVKYTGTGWQIHEGFCSTSSLPHVCKMNSCESTNGRNCIGSEPTTEGPSMNVAVIVVPIILVIVLVLLVAAVVVLLCVWKCNKELLKRYCSCCQFGSSKTAIHSMQQENQRLRHELSQHKVSLSGRFQPGQFLGGERELSGVPDGKGGVLPTIKQPLSSGATLSSPMTTEARRLSLPSAAPGDGQGPVGVPPLVLQQAMPTHTFIKQPSQQSLSFLSNSATRPMRQSLPISFGVSSLPTRPSVPPPVRKTEATAKLGTTVESMSESESSGSDSEHDKDETKDNKDS